MTNRLLLRAVNSISNVNENKILYSCKENARIRLPQLINVIRRGFAVQEENK
jgi:hypothetical protein